MNNHFPFSPECTTTFRFPRSAQPLSVFPGAHNHFPFSPECTTTFRFPQSAQPLSIFPSLQPLGIQGSRESTFEKDRTRCPTPLANSAGQLRWTTPLDNSAVKLRCQTPLTNPSTSRVRGNPLWKKIGHAGQFRWPVELANPWASRVRKVRGYPLWKTDRTRCLIPIASSADQFRRPTPGYPGFEGIHFCKTDWARCLIPIASSADQFRQPTPRHPGFEGIHLEKKIGHAVQFRLQTLLTNSDDQFRWPVPLANPSASRVRGDTLGKKDRTRCPIPLANSAHQLR